jgi:hypothetical protein
MMLRPTAVVPPLGVSKSQNKLLRGGVFALAEVEHEQTFNAEWAGDPNLHRLSLHLSLTNPRGEVENEGDTEISFPNDGWAGNSGHDLARRQALNAVTTEERQSADSR